MINFQEELEINDKTQSFSLGSPINYNSNINLTYSPSQDILSQLSPTAAYCNSSDQMSKQLREAINQERLSFINRCEEIKNQIHQMLSQIE